jgi:ribosomal-protein-alanine N-acetyltransferase
MTPAETPIILTSERLLFRPHIMADMDAYCAMDQDAEVRRYVGGKPRTREEAERRFLNGLQPVTDRMAMWATILKADNSYIGRCGLYPHFNSDGEKIPAEGALGLYIAREHWGKGYATEAGRAFIDFGFNELNIKKIVTAIEAGNDASVRVIESWVLH